MAHGASKEFLFEGRKDEGGALPINREGVVLGTKETIGRMERHICVGGIHRGSERGGENV
jgi:hypothetical protein